MHDNNIQLFAVLKNYGEGNTAVVLYETDPQADDDGYVDPSPWAILSVNVYDDKGTIFPKSNRHIWIYPPSEHTYLQSTLVNEGYLELTGREHHMYSLPVVEVYLTDKFMAEVRERISW